MLMREKVCVRERNGDRNERSYGRGLSLLAASGAAASGRRQDALKKDQRGVNGRLCEIDSLDWPFGRWVWRQEVPTESTSAAGVPSARYGFIRGRGHFAGSINMGMNGDTPSVL